MSDPVTQELFFATIEQLRRDMDDRHQRIRADILAGFEKLNTKAELHAVADQLLGNRVTIIETERRSEAAESMRRSTWIAVVVSGAFTAFWAFVSRLFK